MADLDCNQARHKAVPNLTVQEGATLTMNSVGFDIFKVLQWNTGGMYCFKTELQKTLQKEDIPVFIKLEANITDKKLKYFIFSNYQMHLLPKSHQVASDILVGVWRGLVNEFMIIKSMDVIDFCEMIKLDLWVKKLHFQIYR